MSARGPSRDSVGLALALGLVGLFAVAGLAALELRQARIVDVHELPLEGILGRAASSTEPIWIAYSIRGARRGWGCCSHGPAEWQPTDHCDLEQTRPIDTGPASEPARLTVLARFSGGRVGRLRVVDSDCSIGLGGRTVLDAGARQAGESLAWLRRTLDTEPTPVVQQALAVIAAHASPRATTVLVELARADGPDGLRRQAIFWLGASRGGAGLTVLVERLAGRPAAAEIEAIVFAIHQSDAPEAESTLVRLASSDARPEVRRQALFWLAQSGDRFADVVLEAAYEDPSTEVARHAVFALGLLPAPTASRLLAGLVAQRERPELRREALFWLVQTGRDEAFETLVDVLQSSG